ncbi:MAG: transglycosylase domain-containing protein [Egibacteraceae bacterium]
MSGRDELQTVAPKPRRKSSSFAPGSPKPARPLGRLAAEARVIAAKAAVAVAALLAWTLAALRELRARVEAQTASWARAAGQRAAAAGRALGAARAWLRPRVRVLPARLQWSTRTVRAEVVLGVHTTRERLTSARERLALAGNARTVGFRLTAPLQRLAPVRRALDDWAIAVNERLGGVPLGGMPAVAFAPPAVRWGHVRLFKGATTPPGRHRAPSARAWSLIWRATAVTAGGIAGMLVLVMLAALLLPMAGRSAARSMTLGIAPAEQAVLSHLAQRSVVFAGDGSVLAVVHDEVDRKVVGLSSIPKQVQQAVTTAEDRRFWEHRGYDPDSIARAILANFRAGEIVQGGSTITQQIAKSAVGSEQTFDRKLNELAYAVALERVFTKEQLLERYLNQVYFGWGAYGIAAAAEEYFGVFDPGQLRVEQGALLAGIIRSPGRLDPRRHPQEALERRNHVLQDMADLGYLKRAQADFIVQTPLGVVPPRVNTPVDPYLVEAVKQEFLDHPAFGPDRQARSALFFGGGLRIETSIDLRLQQAARDVVSRYLPNPNGPTAAIATVDPRDGRILAIYGGSDFDQAQYNLATQGRRQPGSSFKPFVMATALSRGYPTSYRLAGNSPLILRGSGLAEWSRRGVSNYGGADYGRIDMRTALVKSVNTAFAQLITIIGTAGVVETAQRMGIDIDEAMGGVRNPAIALGGLLHGVTPLEMASAFSTFANGGSHVTASLINKVTGPDGIVVYERKPQPQQALAPSVNATVVDVMQQAVTEGTGTRARLSAWNAAGKTGTTSRNVDAWFVGYVPVMSTAVWMGYPQGQIPMPGRTGGSIPATIWHAFMSRALEGVAPVAFPSTAPAPGAVATGETVTVPSLVGMSDTEALRALADAKLIAVFKPVSSKSPTGTVVKQRPKAGSTAQAGDPVRINVSKGKDKHKDKGKKGNG